MSVLLFIGATWLFAGVAEDVVTGDPLVAVDRFIAHWFEQHSAPAVTRWMSLVTDAHAAAPVMAAGVAFALYLAWRRDGYGLLTLLLVLPGGMLLNLLMKQIFHRARPVLDEPSLSLASYSFPSGHVTGATLFYGVLATYVAMRMPALGKRAGVYGLACLMVLLVAISRVVLGAHYLSDVVAAAAWGTAWLVLCLVLVRELRRRAGRCPSQQN